MAKSMIEKYRKVLAADPASRLFVELAKALIEKGASEEAIEVCKRRAANAMPKTPIT